MAPHTSETIAPPGRETSVPAANGAPLTPHDLVPHLRGLARALRDRGADRAGRERAPSP
ncbi:MULTISPECIES: hypothetical protein [Nocardiopsis]|uniref:Uncharacterized protein n=1 Tax=Nocardiopsis dassonvillei (strain ATCC 23218 / DSM 43111 / CIP 107115 / JCM 7437 / KCTC 9190 / NBRC 14626 / NCTC 10488 / NRRL B-5397 / IMRU 509) TaxID=446468 RepID=D7B1H4_NOCDD|nr:MULTISPECIES: hypothetical protein [Nocardiopsis]ADH68400.1 conserved hypothetical protein [Nocardiopsis dassonvillei subsp. dassonvillei DSM 43111]NKY80758.1 hypothetical protein [Nocardiopsis dassonvillei]VEI88905.1 Uncharacterised protein [Nocardiopsis dassonvillei]